MPSRFRGFSIEEGETAAAGQLLARDPGILAVTADERLYYLLLSASIDLGWKISWAKTVVRAVESAFSQPAALIVYDERLPGDDWREVLPRLADLPGHPSVLLAASELDERVWERVLRCGGYDAVHRGAGSDEWKRELRFAWHSVSHASEAG